MREYRQTIPACVNAGDTVLEIGCAWGTTSARLRRQAGTLVAIDKSPSIEQARRDHPEVRFERIDCFDVRRVLALGLRFNKVYIDVSGSRDVRDVIRIVMMYEAAFRPELVVVKSTRLKRLVARCEVWRDPPGADPR